ncbi:MAG: hypothetical protein K0R15_1762 [Clostridiales bacterium]|nr:hypothetical protein [Clostridiales bacterium]
MGNTNIEKILEMYKNGNVNLDEASRLLASVGVQESMPIAPVSTECTNIIGIPWEDDGKLRIVVYKGKNLLTKGEAGKQNIDITYRGEAIDVECYGNLTCNDIGGNVKASGNLSCKDIDGSADAMGNISCGDIDGNVNAAGSITSGDIDGSANAGGDIKCGDIDGGVTAGGNVYCDNVDGNVYVGGSVNTK